MNINVQVAENTASRLPTEGYSRESGGGVTLASLKCMARRFRRAVTLQVPVGYEDKTGFHRGELHTKHRPAITELESNKTKTYQF